jgi:hypothetical protein
MSNAGQVALGVVGGVVGFAFGGPTGAAYGLQIGLAVGSVVSPTQLPGTFGPRLNDKRTTTSQLGEPITELYGTDVVAGTVIWLGDVVEHSNTEEVGGKGGPQSENTTFSYTQSIAIGLCRGPKQSVLRIWENGKLVYDVREQQSGESGDVYAMRLSAAAEYDSTFTLYAGDETQLPDPTIELKEGIGNVPAYRGLMYVVYPDRLLKDEQAQRHPSFKFEINSGESAVISTARILMVTTGPSVDIDPYSIIGFPTTLDAPLLTEFLDTVAIGPTQVDALDICGKGATLFAVGQLSVTQYWARTSSDGGVTWEPVVVLPLFASAPELPKQIKPNHCDCGASGRVVVSGEIVDAGSTDVPALAYTDDNGVYWLQSTYSAVESDFRFGVVRYIPELDIWLCGGYRGIAKSADGVAWASVLSGLTNYNPVQFAYGDGRVAALLSGTIAESTDGGESWATVFSDGFSQLALAFGAGVWVRWDNGVDSVIDPGFSVASTPAGPWSALARPTGWDIRDIAYDGTQFVAGGADGAGATLIGVSQDGVLWEVASSGHLAAASITRVQQGRDA